MLRFLIFVLASVVFKREVCRGCNGVGRVWVQVCEDGEPIENHCICRGWGFRLRKESK